jgi:cytochrome c oxidase cbb3-type subunit 2
MDALVAYLQVLGTLVDVNAAAAQEDLATEKGR